MGFNSKTPAPPRVLAVVVNWNKCSHLRALLASLRSLAGEPFDLLVVDNASTDGSPEMVRTEYPGAALLETGANLGGTGGFNAGMAWGLKSPANYEYLWLMDNDINVHPGALDALVAAMVSDPTTGLVGSTILIMEAPGRVQEIGARVDWKTAGLERNCETDFAAVKRPQILECDYVAACSALARTDAIRATGLWDPNYFIAWDDIDWGVRMKRAGWRVVATTESIVEHEGYSDRRISAGPGSVYIWQRNCFYFLHRNCPPALRAHALFHQFRYMLARVENLRADGRLAEANAIAVSIDHFFRDRLGGPPPKELGEVRDLPRTLGPLPHLRLRRIVLLVVEHHHLALRFRDELKAAHPHARIDVLIPDSGASTLRTKIPGARRLPLGHLHQRVAFGLHLALRCDAVVAHALAPRYAFEALAPCSIRFDANMQCEVRRRDAGSFLASMLRRVAVLGKALALTARALLKPVRPTVCREQVIVKPAAPAGRWRRTAESPGERAWSAIVALALLPFAILSGALSAAALPFLRSRDRAKGLLRE